MPEAPASNGIVVADFDPRVTDELVRMWRASFEHGVGITDPHPIEEQVAYFIEHVLPNNRVRVAAKDDEVVGFMASTAESITQLFVRVDHIGQGIGTRLLRVAQDDSAGGLWLYTFARNQAARRFYERRGFVLVARGFEPMWRLDDVKYEWRRGPHGS